MILPHDVGDVGLGNAVLQGHDHALLRQHRFEGSDDFFIEKLLRHQKDDVIFSGHFVGEDGVHRNGKIHGAFDMSSLFPQRLYVGLITVDQFYRQTGFGHIGSQHCAQ